MKHSDPAVLEALDFAWDADSGVLGKLRSGVYDAELGAKYIELLEGIEIADGESLHPDFVRLVWFAPLFSEWQLERVAENGGDQSEAHGFADLVRERLMGILGVP
ncbi:hypothetical protein ACFY97_07840 [Streptomyces klenkii]|uniref:hypothetical protein n=1 Tax=Streptomyces klenkii TaxID=1420899 RepID=UPI0011C3A14D|nr:hypothetical protein [Streptomyces klenkii]